MHSVLQATRLEGDHRCTANEELMLHDTTRFEGRWHETEITTHIHERSIHEEGFGVGPEVVWVDAPQTLQFVRALRRILLTHVGWSSHQDVNLSLHALDEFLGNVDDEVHSLLFRDATHKPKHGNVVHQLGALEVLLLEELLGA